jgi:hypothetical protein
MTTAYIENISQRSRCDVRGKLIVQMSLPKSFGVGTPGLSVKQGVKNHICID